MDKCQPKTRLMSTITSLEQLDLTKRYTYADYMRWQFKERVELLKGWIWPMAAPNAVHQEISFNFSGLLWAYIRNKACKVYVAPFDVRLPLPSNKVNSDTDKMDTVVQPDLCVICDLSKIKKQGCVGAPDLVIEILSPGNSKREMRDKYELYEAAGVLEYWIVDPDRRNVLVYVLTDGRFANASRPLTDEDVLQSSIFPNLAINLTQVFPEEIEMES